MITNIHSRLGRMTPWLAMASMMTVNTASEAASSSCVSTELASPKFDKYGGWNGVTTTATGRFRTEKIDGRWWIITPEGHGMWINGPSNITPHNIDKNGVDEYNAKIIRKYGSEENWVTATSERMTKLGINSTGGWDNFKPGRFSGKKAVAINAEFYSTAPAVTMWHPSNIKNSEWPKGPTGVNLRDVFDSNWPAKVAGRAAQTNGLYSTDKEGKYSGVQKCINNPWCIGIYTDNELPRGSSFNAIGTHLDAYMAQVPRSAGKKALQKYFENRYHGNLLAFNLTWYKWIWSWDDLQNLDHLHNSLFGLGSDGITDELYLSFETPGQKADRIGFEAEVAKQYFSVIHRELKRLDPQMLILGDREISIFSHPEIYKAMAPYVDVVSINNYPFDQLARGVLSSLQGIKRYGYLFTDNPYDDMTTVAKLTDKPTMVTEFYWRAYRMDATDRGVIYPPLMPTVLLPIDQALNFKSYQQRMMANPNVVGSSWFEWTDEPAIGRGSEPDPDLPLTGSGPDKFGAENSSIGIVDENDELKKPIADTMQSLNNNMYAIRCGKIVPQPQKPVGEISVLSAQQLLNPAL